MREPIPTHKRKARDYHAYDGANDLLRVAEDCTGGKPPRASHPLYTGLTFFWALYLNIIFIISKENTYVY